jgi:DUF438 domain-containing protein
MGGLDRAGYPTDMSELLQNAARRKEILKHMILQLNDGIAPDEVRPQLLRLLGKIPYAEVVEVEQELLGEGLPVEETRRLCDLHHAALQGTIQISTAPLPPPGHPAHTFLEENSALRWEIASLRAQYAEFSIAADGARAAEALDVIRRHFNNVMDVEKHYLRKEYLLFPFLEKRGITGPPKVMWGKHDETRALLEAAADTLRNIDAAPLEQARGLIEFVVIPAADSVADMTEREEHILLPMCMDILTEEDWGEIARQSGEYGYCLYDPPDAWRPAGQHSTAHEQAPEQGRIQLPSGSMTPVELLAILNTIPFDLTFVDKEDRVRYFTQGRERIFSRSRAIIGRKVQFCHPPSSVHVVEKILADFRSGAQERAAFWIDLRGRFVHIEYFALRDSDGGYLGCLEVSQDLTEKRALTGEQRLLAFGAPQNASLN